MKNYSVEYQLHLIYSELKELRKTQERIAFALEWLTENHQNEEEPFEEDFLDDAEGIGWDINKLI